MFREFFVYIGGKQGSIVDGRIPSELVAQIVQAHDIVDIVGRRVALKRSGRNYFGLCPFHPEKTPSFSVAADKQIYYCFGCGAGGDVIRFIRESEQYTFAEAIQYLADLKGIALPEQFLTEDPAHLELEQIKKILKMSAELYHHILVETEEGNKAFEYLVGRGITEKTMEEFQLGFAPATGHILYPYLKEHGYNESLCLKAGVVGVSEAQKRYYDYFRDRILFPIHDIHGNVVGFGGRTLEGGAPKYLNGPETPLFRKKNLLFNMHRARIPIRQEKKAVLFEGYMDVITSWQEGLKTGIASLGTSLSDDHARIISQHAGTVVVCYDADVAGQTAALRSLEIFRKHQCMVKVAQMPEHFDPDDYIRLHGLGAFQTHVLEQTMSLTGFRLHSLHKEYDVRDEAARLQFLSCAMAIIAEIPAAIEQDHYLRKLSEEFHISLASLKEELQQLIKKNTIQKKTNQKKTDKDVSRWNNGYRGSRTILPKEEASERILVAYMMQNPEVIQWVAEAIGDQFVTEIYAALSAYLYAYALEGSGDMQAFLETLPDDTLISEASALMMLELPGPLSKEAFEDYVRHIRMVPLKREIERKEKMIKDLARVGEEIQAAHIAAEVTRLRKKLLHA